MKFGLSLDQYKILEKVVINPLKDLNAKIYIFGSRARGDNHPFSDIDILFELASSNPRIDSQISQIKENAENSNLSIKVDLVNIAHLAESYKDSVFKDRVEII